MLVSHYLLVVMLNYFNVPASHQRRSILLKNNNFSILFLNGKRVILPFLWNTLKKIIILNELLLGNLKN